MPSDKLPPVIRPKLDHEGQPYVDEEVIAWPRNPEPVEAEIRKMFRRGLPPPILLAYNHVRLNWLKPGKNGKLVPR